MQEFRFGEYFSGPGGMSRGALNAFRHLAPGVRRMRSVWAVDYDKDACRTYHANIHGGHGVLASQEDDGPVQGIDTPQTCESLVLNADVRKVDPSKLADIDAFLFGFPCNDFSLAGERKGFDGDFGMLYEYGLKVIKVKRPQFFVAENVSGLLHANDYGAFLKIIEDLRLSDHGDMGYEVVPHLYRFEQYGVPQTRHRIIIVGIRKDVSSRIGSSFLPPAPSNVLVSAGEALSGLNPDAPNNQPKKVSPLVLERLKHIPLGHNIWDVNDRIPERLRLHASKTDISVIYKVLDPSKPAYTVVGSGGGGTHMYHWDRRPTTDRERARLQTFEDDFEFLGTVTSIRRQIGMAVPPLGAQKIIEAVINTLDGIAYDHVEPNLLHELDPDWIEQKRIRKKAAKEGKARGRAKRALQAQAELPLEPLRGAEVQEAA
jgi:DNA (cytosine-5)-methyltransferase 1